MGLKARALAILIVALAPSAYLAWTWRAMPQLALHHDDAIYWVCAKSLGSGAGYKIESLPAQPWQTKYPPLFPALLSLVWKVNPAFPGNLKLAMLVVWLAMPAYLLMARAWFKQVGVPEREAGLLTGIAGFSPIACVLSITLMSELLFTALLLACLVLAERAERPDGSRWIVAAGGVLAGLAYLTRSAALPLLLTVPLCLVLRSQRKRAVGFAACMLPFIVAWQWWVAAHLSRAKDLVTLYYTNYAGFQAYNVSVANLPRVVWHNFDAITGSIGKLLTFDLMLFDSKNLERVVAVAAIAGTIRWARRTGHWQYPAAGAGMIALMLVWHFPPNERFLMPLYPLLALGLWTELKNFAAALRNPWASGKSTERAMAGVFALGLACFAVFMIATHLTGDFFFVPRVLAGCESDLRSNRPVYAWLAQNTSSNATLYAYQDPLAYLYTGRHASWLPIPPKLFYLDNPKLVERFVSSAPTFAQEQNLDYMLLTSTDYYLDSQGVALRNVCRLSIEHDADFREIFETPHARVYRRLHDAKDGSK